MTVRPVTSLLICLVTVILFSCQSGQELHYFKCGNNYYRLRINESSFASKARYMSGFYDEKAVDRYFGEMSQPVEKDTTSVKAVTFISGRADDYTPDQLKIDSNKKLVLILSTNSNAISEQIGAFAENDRILSSIMQLANKDKIQESIQALSNIANLKKRNKATIDLGDAFIESLSDTATAANVKTNINIFLQFIKDQSPANTTTSEVLLHNFQKIQ